MAKLQMYQKEAYCDLLSLIRTPSFFLPALLFPLVFYVFFGIVMNFSGNPTSYMLVSYVCFGVMGPSLFNFAASVASDRVQGWLTLKQLSPMPLMAYVGAKYFSSLVFSLVIALVLFVTAAVFADVRLETWQWLSLLVIALAGTLPFALLGLLMGLCFSEKAAPAVVNLVYLPMAFLSGLWVPVMYLPEAVQFISPWLPAYHFAQLSYAVIGAQQSDSLLGHIAYLVVFSAGLLAIVTWRYQRLYK